MPERLALHALLKWPLCRHQLCRPWNFFGKRLDSDRGETSTVSGVVIPECVHEGCRKFGKPGYRLLESDLA